jgi:hypothetical protein
MVASHTLRKSAEHLHMQVVIDIKLPLNASMLEQENAIQAALNQAGLRCTGLLLESLDTDGQPLLVRDARGGQVRLSAKGRKVPRQIETPYGSLNVARHVYQSSAGGACLVPLDQAAALLGAATPKFAQMVASKVAELPARSVARDLSQNHQRAVSLAQLQDLSGRVGELARAQQEHLPMEQAELPAPWQVATITLGVDAASMLMNSAGTPAAASDRRKHRQLDWRMAMVGTISFYDAQGERLHTLYAAQSPPEDPAQGKQAFWAQMDAQVARIKALYPKARYTGVSDGAPDLAAWLQQHTEVQVLDYYHAASYLELAAPAFLPRPEEAAAWAAMTRQDLRDLPGAAGIILEEMRERARRPGTRMSPAAREGLEKAIGYIEPRAERMDYARLRQQGIPVGSGVTESACKLIIKQRMCGPGMRWSHRAADHLLALRCLLHSDGMWRVLWSKLSPKNNPLAHL